MSRRLDRTRIGMLMLCGLGPVQSTQESMNRTHQTGFEGYSRDSSGFPRINRDRETSETLGRESRSDNLQLKVASARNV